MRTRPALSPTMRSKLGAGSLQPPEDLGRPLGQQHAGGREPDPATRALERRAPVSASSRERWWLTVGCV